MRAINTLMQNICRNRLRSKDINPASFFKKWDSMSLTLIKFTPQVSMVKLTNGSHRIHWMLIFKKSYDNRMKSLQDIVTK